MLGGSAPRNKPPGFCRPPGESDPPGSPKAQNPQKDEAHAGLQGTAAGKQTSPQQDQTPAPCTTGIIVRAAGSGLELAVFPLCSSYSDFEEDMRGRHGECLEKPDWMRLAPCTMWWCDESRSPGLWTTPKAASVLTKGKLSRSLSPECADACGEWGLFVIN